jgi:hypothetical protein
VNGGRSSNRGGKATAQIEQRNGFVKRKNDEPWSVASSVDSAGALEDLGDTRINIRRAIEDGSALLGGGIAHVEQVVIPAGRCGPGTAVLIPVRGMRTGREVDTCKRRVGCLRDGLRRDVAERSDSRWLRKFTHER